MPAQRDGEAGASLARGGASAGATQSPPLPPPPLLPLRLHQAAFLLSTASLVIINSKHGCNDLLALILSALAHSVCTSFMLLAPRQYWQHRYWFLPAVRLPLHLAYRRIGIGTPKLLDHPATPGVLGAVVDFLRICIGTRALGLAMSGLILSQPPAATLLLQAVLAALLITGNREGYCSTQLLASPLSHARMQRLAVALEAATLPAAVALQPMSSGASALAAGLPILAGRQDACPAVIPFVHILLAVLMPTIVVLRSWHPPPPDRHHPAQRPCSLYEKAVAAFAAADRTLHRLLLGGAPWRTLLVVWYCSTAVWWACRFTLQG